MGNHGIKGYALGMTLHLPGVMATLTYFLSLSPFNPRGPQLAQSRRRPRRLVPEGGLRPPEHVRETHQTVRKRRSSRDHQDAQVQEHGSRWVLCSAHVTHAWSQECGIKGEVGHFGKCTTLLLHLLTYCTNAVFLRVVYLTYSPGPATSWSPLATGPGPEIVWHITPRKMGKCRFYTSVLVWYGLNKHKTCVN